MTSNTPPISEQAVLFECPKSGKQYPCRNLQELQDLVNREVVERESLIYTKRGRTKAETIPGLTFPESRQDIRGNVLPGISKLNSYFFVYLICAGATALLVYNPLSLAFPLITMPFKLPLQVFQWVIELFLIYEFWKVISTAPIKIARTTPVMAAFGCAIPVFNIYWAFTAYKGLAEDMNTTLRQHGLDQYCIWPGLALLYSVLIGTQYILFLNNIPAIGTGLFNIIAIPGVIAEILFLWSAKNASIALIEQAARK